MNNLFTVEIDKETTLEELFGEHKNDIEIVLNEKYIPTDDWCRTYVKPNDIVLVYLLPKGGGGGGNKAIRTVLMIAIVVAVVVFQQHYLTPTLGGFASAAISVGITMAASWALYQIFPDPKPKEEEIGSGAQGQEGTSLSSSKNAPAPYAPLSKMYGIKRVKPVLAATPDVNLNGNDQVVSCLYFLNHGPISIRKGNTEYYIGNNNYKVIHKPSAYVSNCSQLIDFSSMSNLDDYGYDNQPFARISDTSLQALKDADQYFKFVVGTPRALLEAYPQLNTDKVLEQIDYVFNPYEGDTSVTVNQWFSYGKYSIKLDLNQQAQIFDLYFDEYKGRMPAFYITYKIENDSTEYLFPDFAYATGKWGIPILKEMVSTDSDSRSYSYYTVVFREYTDQEKNSLRSAINTNDSYILNQAVNLTNPYFGKATYIDPTKGVIPKIRHLPDPTKRITEIILNIDKDTHDSYRGNAKISKLIGYSNTKYLGGAFVNSSAVNPYSIDIHIYADSGLYALTKDNHAAEIELNFQCKYWVSGYNNITSTKILSIKGNSKSPVRKTLTISYTEIKDLLNRIPSINPENTRIEFEITLGPTITWYPYPFVQSTVIFKFIETTQNIPRTKEIRKADGTISQEKYYVLGGLSSNIDIVDHSVVAWLQVSANNVLRGTIDSFDICFGGLVEDKTSPKYNTPFGESYHYILSLNPAEIFIDILTQKGIVKPVPLTRIDMPELLEWRDWCNAFYNNKYTALPPISNRYYPSFEFSKYITDNTTVIQLLKEVTAAGLAKFTFKNGKFSIARDKANLLPVQMITPRNSWGFKAVKTLYKQPEAIRISYVSKKNWEQVETFVFLPGIDPTTKTKDIIEVQTTVPMEEYQAQRVGMMYLASTQLRSEVYTVSMDVEAISFEVGDLVILSYDTVAIGKSYGRISSIENTNGYWYISVDEPCPIDPTRSQSVLIRIFKNNMVQFTSYIINPSISTSKKLAINTQTIDNISIGDLFTFGDTTTISIKCKVTNMQFDSNQNVAITLIEDVPAIHDIYLKDEYPTYTPIVSSEPNYKLLRTRPPKIINITSGVFP